MYADDQYVNRQALKMTFLQDIGLAHRLVMVSNGQEVLDYFDNVLENLDLEQDRAVPLQPVSLLLLDINMPLLSGLQTLVLLKEKFKKLNDKLAK